MYGEIEKLLTDDDKKILRRLSSIDSLFKKGNINICEIFANNGHLIVTIEHNGIEYEIDDFYNIRCDGGDCESYGINGIHSINELLELLEKY